MLIIWTQANRPLAYNRLISQRLVSLKVLWHQNHYQLLYGSEWGNELFLLTHHERDANTAVNTIPKLCLN